MAIGRIIDISSNNHPHNVVIDWPAVARAGVTSVFVKATEGTGYVNPWYATDMRSAAAVGIDTCAYHFAGTGNPIAEAQRFMSVAGDKARVLDYETNTNVAWARTFLQALGRPRGELLIYGSLSTLRTFYNQVPAMAWVAAYGQGPPGFGVCWQFTDAAAVSGIPTAVDENQWRGDETNYASVFGLFEPPEPPDTEEDEMALLYATRSNGTGFVIEADLSAKRGVADGDSAGALLGTGIYHQVKLTDQQIDLIPTESG